MVGRIREGRGDGEAVIFDGVIVGGDEVSGGAPTFTTVAPDERGFVLRSVRGVGHAIFEAVPNRWVSEAGVNVSPCPGDACIIVRDRCAGPLVGIAVEVSGFPLDSGDVRVRVVHCNGVSSYAGARVRWKESVGGTFSAYSTVDAQGYVTFHGLPLGPSLTFEAQHVADEAYLSQGGFTLTYAADLLMKIKAGEGESCADPTSWVDRSEGEPGALIASGVTGDDGKFCFDPSDHVGESVLVKLTGLDPVPDECFEDADDESFWIVTLYCNTTYELYWRPLVEPPPGPCVCCAPSCGTTRIPRDLVAVISPGRVERVTGGYGGSTCSQLDVTYNPFRFKYGGWTRNGAPLVGGGIGAGNPYNDHMACDDEGLYFLLNRLWVNPFCNASPCWYPEGLVVAWSQSLLCFCIYPTQIQAVAPRWEKVRPTSVTCDPFVAVFEFPAYAMRWYTLTPIPGAVGCRWDGTYVDSEIPAQTVTVYKP